MSFSLKLFVAIFIEDPHLDPSSINQTAKAKGVKYSSMFEGITLTHLFSIKLEV